MKKKSRSTSPTVMLWIGIGAIAAMGSCAAFLSNKMPVLQLTPELDKIYGVHGFKCAMRPKDLRIDVTPPRELALDRFGRRRLGAIAFRRYLALTKGNTIVEAVYVLTPDGPDGPGEVVRRDQYEAYAAADERRNELAQGATIAAGSSATITSLAAGFVGATVAVSVDGDESRGRRAASWLIQSGGISLVRIATPAGRPIEVGPDLQLWNVAPLVSRS